MKQIRLVGSVFALLSVITLSITGCSGDVVTVGPRAFSLYELQDDFKQFQKKIEGTNPLYYVNKDELSSLFASQYALLQEGMSELDFLRILSPIVSQLKCGHSHVYTSPEYQAYLSESSTYLPFEIRVIRGKVYIIKDLSSVGIPAGSEIVNIDGRTSADIVGTLLQNLSADGDNETKKYYIMNEWFNGVYYYYIDNPAAFTIQYREPQETAVRTATVDSIANKQMYINTMLPYRGDFKGEYSKEVYEDYAVLTITLFTRFDSVQKYKAFLKEFFMELADKNISNLILDVRGNWGGNPDPAAELLSYLINEPTPYLDKNNHFLMFKHKRPIKPNEHKFAGNLYTLIDGAGFSTTAHLLSLLKYHNIGTLVGEEAGGGFLCTDASKETTLRNTKLRLYSSTMVFRAAAQGQVEGRGIMPDYEVIYTLDDYLNGTDPIRNKALQLITSR